MLKVGSCSFDCIISFFFFFFFFAYLFSKLPESTFYKEINKFQ